MCIIRLHEQSFKPWYWFPGFYRYLVNHIHIRHFFILQATPGRPLIEDDHRSSYIYPIQCSFLVLLYAFRLFENPQTCRDCESTPPQDRPEIKKATGAPVTCVGFAKKKPRGLNAPVARTRLSDSPNAQQAHSKKAKQHYRSVQRCARYRLLC